MERRSPLSDGHSGVVLPVPISNTEVKNAYVSAGTAFICGKTEKLSSFFIKILQKFINQSVL